MLADFTALPVMGWRRRLVRKHPAIWLGATVVAIGVAVSAGWVVRAAGAPLRYTNVARVELPLPSDVDRRGTVGTGERGRIEGLANLRPDPALIEDGPLGPLPRIGPDGRRPFLAYARPFNLEDRRPKVAVLLLGLGLQSDYLDAALALPGPISLQFSPYAPDLPALVERARRAGHEVLLELPMEPADHSASDRGPQTLLADGARDENSRRLNWLLARAAGYVAFAGGGERFAGSDQAAAVLDVLAQRGLALIELGGDQLAAAAAAVGLPYASASDAIDGDPAALSIDYALAALEAEALTTGSVLGVAQGYPVSLERLRLWAATLEDKGLVLAPVSAVLIEQAGLAREVPNNGQRAPARSEG